MLPDGTYPVIVVDAEGPDHAGTFHVELTVLTGDHKGELVSVAATNLGIDALNLLAVPGTLVVADGEPVLTLEP